MSGWTNNITGVNALCVGIGIGFLRHLHIQDDFIIDIICADFVVNTTLAAIWTTADKVEEIKQIPEPEVYHVTSKGFFLTSRKFIKFEKNFHFGNKMVFSLFQMCTERLGKDSITLRRYSMLHSMKSI